MGGNARARRECNRQDELDKSGSKQHWGEGQMGGGLMGTEKLTRAPSQVKLLGHLP